MPPVALLLTAPWRRPQDWHLASEFPSYRAYTCPPCFRDDWLNEWFDARRHADSQRRQGEQQQEQQQGEQQRQQQQGEQQRQQQEGEQRQQQQPGAEAGVQASDYRFVYLGPAVGGRGSRKPAPGPRRCSKLHPPFCFARQL